MATTPRSAVVEYDAATHTLTARWEYDCGGRQYSGPQDDTALIRWAQETWGEETCEAAAEGYGGGWSRNELETLETADVIWIAEEDDA